MSDDNCLDAAGRESPVKLVRCHGMGGNQAWNYSEEVSEINKLNIFYNHIYFQRHEFDFCCVT